jgi:integrase
MNDLSSYGPTHHATIPEHTSGIGGSIRVTFMRHTSMPLRIQRTPHGDVTLTSRWTRDQYLLQASGPLEALQWMFPKMGKPAWNNTTYRHAFVPDTKPVTVERDLRKICGIWQDSWNERLVEEWQQQQATPSGSPAAEPVIRTLGAMIQGYLEARVGELAPRTMERNRHYLNRWLEVLGTDQDINRIDNPMLVKARQRLTARLSPGTINVTFAVLRTCIRWAIDRGHLDRDPTKGIKPLRDPGATKERPWWTAAEVTLALACAQQVDKDLAGRAGNVGNTAELLVALGCLLGLRYEEIVMLRWEDIDLNAIHPTTGQPEPVCRVRPHGGWQPKDGEERPIPIQTDLAAILRSHRQPSGYVLVAKKAMPVRGATRPGYRYDAQAVWNRIIRAVEASGGKRITPHGMRHSFASNLLMAGVSDVLVARWLGHADTSMLHQRYGHILAYHSDINKFKLT